MKDFLYSKALFHFNKKKYKEVFNLSLLETVIMNVKSNNGAILDFINKRIRQKNHLIADAIRKNTKYSLSSMWRITFIFPKTV